MVPSDPSKKIRLLLCHLVIATREMKVMLYQHIQPASTNCSNLHILPSQLQKLNINQNQKDTTDSLFAAQTNYQYNIFHGWYYDPILSQRGDGL